MAKVDGPLFSLNATGSIGDTLTYTTSKGVKIVKKFTASPDAQTAAQIQQRTLYQNFVELWNGLTPPEKEQWNDLAKGQALTGFNLFMQNFLNIGPEYLLWMRYGVGKYGVNTYGRIL